MGKDSTAAGGNGKGAGGIPLMRKYHYKTLGMKKAATAAGRNRKGTSGIPLTGKDHYEIVGVNKAATAGGDGNGKRLAGAKGTGGPGWGGASTFSPTDHSTFKEAVKVMNEYYYEEENSGAFEDDGAAFSSTHRTTMKTAVKVTNEYYHKEETLVFSEDGDKEEAKDIQGDEEHLADEDDDGAEMGDDGGGYGDYNEDAGTGDFDDFLNGDNYYYDVAAAGFDDGYDDGGDGPDDWW